jgi:hypothetical protein
VAPRIPFSWHRKIAAAVQFEKYLGSESNHRRQFEVGIPVHTSGLADDAPRKRGRIVTYPQVPLAELALSDPTTTHPKRALKTRGYAARLVKEAFTVNAVAPSLLWKRT